MKTTMKFTVLAVITVLAALACTPELTLTNRDFSEIRDAKKYADAPAFTPKVTNNSRPTYVSSPGVPTETQKELSFDFPGSADILNRNITTADLYGFMSMYTFSNGSSEYTELSTKEADVNFEFSRRRRVNADTEAIIVKLTEVPNKTFVVKIDATKYTFAWGSKLDYNKDGIAGEAYYDDVYITVTPINVVATTGNYIHPGSLNFQLNIVTNFDTGNSATTLGMQNIIVAALNLGNNYSSPNRKIQQKGILEAIINMNKIKFQKYDPNTKSWTDTGALVNLQDTAPQNETSGYWYPFVSIAPQDGDIYRTYASGMRSLTTTSEFLGIKQKIRVSGGNTYGLADPSFKNDTVISDPVLFYNSNRKLHTTTPVNSSILIKVTYDASGKNVVLEMFFTSINITVDNMATTSWLKELDIGTFNNSFKLAYYRNSPNSQISLTTATKWDDIIFIPIKDITYSAENTPQSTAPQVGKNKITITLDPSYQISQDRSRTISLLLSPNFKYDNDLITFGDFTVNGSGIIINGVGFWRAYPILDGNAYTYFKL